MAGIGIVYLGLLKWIAYITSVIIAIFCHIYLVQIVLADNIVLYRNKAIKALDERLQKVQSEQKDNEEWPDLDDEKQPAPKSGEDTVSTSSISSSKSDIVRIEVDASSPSE